MCVCLEWSYEMQSEVIDRDLLFYTFDDFMILRNHIKDRLEHLTRKDYIIYGMYVESRPWIKEYYRGCIWDFLNDYMSEEELIEVYDKFKNPQKKNEGDLSA